MLKSMTGYGERTEETARYAITVETRSVNNRFLKLISKVPEEVSFLQSALEQRIRERVQRGSVYLTVRFAPTDASELYEIDSGVLGKYVRQLDGLKRELGRADEAIALRDLLLLPGVVRCEEGLVPDKEDILPVAERALEGALDGLCSMRYREGEHLHDVLQQGTQRLEELLKRIRTEAPRSVEEHHQKLEGRVRQLLGENQASLAPEDLVKEMAILADRADITEEIARMESHIRQFAESLASEAAVGRKLEFIVQEMFRESNTMGSKSANSRLNESVVELKAEIERLKEQVANIE